MGLFPAEMTWIVAYLFVALSLCWLAVLVLLLGERYEPDSVPLSRAVVEARRMAAAREHDDVTLPDVTRDLDDAA